jgi:hypothetical protein
VPGYLDKQAKSVRVEFFRYVDKDIFGKILFKNFVTNILKLREPAFTVALARHGERHGRKLDADAEIYFRRKTINIEIKFSHLNIVHPDKENLRCWSFSKVLETGKQQPKRFDFLFAVGVLSLGLSEADYWEELLATEREFRMRGRNFPLDAAPYDASFLNRCGFFIIPHAAIKTKGVTATVRADGVSQYKPFFAWGFDTARCNQLWQRVVEEHFATRKQTSEQLLHNQDRWPASNDGRLGSESL